MWSLLTRNIHKKPGAHLKPGFRFQPSAGRETKWTITLDATDTGRVLESPTKHRKGG
jgi:hypothetical protein